MFAKLYLPSGDCCGLHCFFIPIRDPETLLTYPGITVIDMGHKLGLNGVDNGYVSNQFIVKVRTDELYIILFESRMNESRKKSKREILKSLWIYSMKDIH